MRNNTFVGSHLRSKLFIKAIIYKLQICSSVKVIWKLFNPFHFGFLCISNLLKLQTGWSQDQVPHMWDLVLAPACLPPTLLFQKILPKKCTCFKLMQMTFSRWPFCISAYNGLNNVFWPQLVSNSNCIKNPLKNTLTQSSR